MNTDLISDMLTKIRNAQTRSKTFIEVPYSRLSENVARVLVQKGFLVKIKTFKRKGLKYKGLGLELKYLEGGEPAITKLQRISKPSLRAYVSSKNIKPVLGNLGFDVISTSKGVISSDEARKRRLGGEVICRVY